MTVRIDNVQTLADLLELNAGNRCLCVSVLKKTGACIRQFHRAGVWHADLNVRNILLDKNRKITLIDFDRAKFNPRQSVNGGGNLLRLKRSLQKLQAKAGSTHLDVWWDGFMQGYHE